MATLPHSHSGAAFSLARQSVARGVQPQADRAPGPMQTRLPPAIASGQPYNAKSGEGCNPSPPDLRQLRKSSNQIQALHHKGFSFTFEYLCVVFLAVLNRPAQQRHRSNEVGLCAINWIARSAVKFGLCAVHSSQSCMSTPLSGAFT